MFALKASMEETVDRHNRLHEALSYGQVIDPEWELFLILLSDLPPDLRDTPWLAAVSWSGGQHDLLFTDGRGSFVAVEVKKAPEIYGTGRSRRNRRTKHRQRRNKLVEQTWCAGETGARLLGQPVRALGLWFEAEGWRVLSDIVSEPLARCA